MLLYPSTEKYQQFLEKLLEIFHDAMRSAGDGRLDTEGRQERVTALEARLAELLQPHTRETNPKMPPHEHTFTNLANELDRLLRAKELFTFVLVPEVV